MSKRTTKRDSVVETFHGLFTSSSAATQELLNLNPTNMNVAPAQFTRVPAVADNWAQYRVLALRFRLHSIGSSNAVAAGFVGGVQDTPPSTAAQVMELLPSTYLGPSQQVPSKWVNVPRKDLAGPLSWYKTVLGTADATEESPGVLVVTHTTMVFWAVEAYITYEFKAAVAPGNTPAALAYQRAVAAERKRALQEGQRARLLSVLAAPLAAAPTLPPTAGGSSSPPGVP